MAANSVNLRLQSKVDRVDRDGRTASPFPTASPRRGISPPSSQTLAYLKEPPLYGPPQPDEVADNSTLTDSLVNYLLRTVQRQKSITEEQNRRIADQEWSKWQLTHLCNALSLPRNRSVA